MRVTISKDREVQIGVQYGKRLTIVKRLDTTMPLRVTQVKMTLRNKDGEVIAQGVGEAICGVSDQFDKTTGRKCAIRRAFDKLHLSQTTALLASRGCVGKIGKEDRKVIYKRFLSRFANKMEKRQKEKGKKQVS
jgi:hypothetical protein